MYYIDVNTMTYPRDLKALRDLNPNVSFPAIITNEMAADFGFYPVTTIDLPKITATQKMIEGKPEQGEDDQWYQTWTVIDFTEEEITDLVMSIKQQKKQQIESKRDAILKAGFHFTHEDKDLSLQTRDDEDRINWLGVLNASSAMIMAGAGDSPTKIRTAENDIITLTYSQAQMLMLQTLNYQSSVYEAAWHHKDALDLLTTMEEVNAYDVESGWPS